MACAQHAVVKDVAGPTATRLRNVAVLISKDCIRTAPARAYFVLAFVVQFMGKMLNQDEARGVRVSGVGWEAEGRGAEAGAHAGRCAASAAARVEGAVSGARDVADAGRGLEFAESAVLYGAVTRVLGRERSVWVSARALLGAGESRALARRGAECEVAVARDERA